MKLLLSGTIELDEIKTSASTGQGVAFRKALIQGIRDHVAAPFLVNVQGDDIAVQFIVENDDYKTTNNTDTNAQVSVEQVARAITAADRARALLG